MKALLVCLLFGAVVFNTGCKCGSDPTPYPSADKNLDWSDDGDDDNDDDDGLLRSRGGPSKDIEGLRRAQAEEDEDEGDELDDAIKAVKAMGAEATRKAEEEDEEEAEEEAEEDEGDGE